MVMWIVTNRGQTHHLGEWYGMKTPLIWNDEENLCYVHQDLVPVCMYVMGWAPRRLLHCGH